MLQHLLSFLTDLVRIASCDCLCCLFIVLFHPLAAPGTASVCHSLIVCHQVGLFTSWEAEEKSLTPQLQQKRGLLISRLVCALYFILY